MSIPDEAVEAAARAMADLSEVDNGENQFADFARAALEAAAPIMRQAFFLEMNLRAVQDELNTPLQLGRAIHGND